MALPNMIHLILVTIVAKLINFFVIFWVSEQNGECKAGYTSCRTCAEGYYASAGNNGVNPTCTGKSKLCQCYLCHQCNITVIMIKFHIALECGCNALGSVSPNCNDGNGKCTCISGVTGIKCTECDIGYVDFPTCVTCADGYYASAGISGVNATTCTGKSKCKILALV